MPAGCLHVCLFGLFRLLQEEQRVAGFEQARLQHNRAYLVLHRDASISRQQLAFLLWPDSTDRQARKNLRTLPTRLRRALPDSDHSLDISATTLRPDSRSLGIVH